ncbi:hypothetical protein HGB25_02070 [Candidatus Saccharibacteria bacterium]|nr:hypothetical protein [Candidatus Saccharibacteria bacterium]
MFLVGILTWWYSDGFQGYIQTIKKRLASTSDYFSIGLLAVTLFAPYRQISAGRVSGSLADRMHAFFDRSISRAVGAVVRSCMIFAGIIAMALQLAFYAVMILLWLLAPVIPALGLIAWIIGLGM